MIAVIYKTDSNEVIGRIEDVQQYNETDVIGKDASSRGIDKTKADFIIVESTSLNVGDTIDLTQITDVRHLIPETLEQKAARLESENIEVMLALTAVYEELLAIKSGGTA